MGIPVESEALQAADEVGLDAAGVDGVQEGDAEVDVGLAGRQNAMDGGDQGSHPMDATIHRRGRASRSSG